MESRYTKFNDQLIHPDIKKKVSEIHQLLSDYETLKGPWRMFWDQGDISKLRTLHNKLKSVTVDRFLNLSEAYDLISILVDNRTKQNSLSSKILQALERDIFDLVSLGRLLRKHHCFNEKIFNIIYQRLEHISAIKSNAYHLDTDSLKPLPAYFELLCQYSEKYNPYLHDIIIQCKSIKMNEAFIENTIKQLLSQTVSSSALWNMIRDVKTENELEQILSQHSEFLVLSSQGVINKTCQVYRV